MPVEFDIKGTEAIEDILRMLPQKYAKKPMVAAFRRAVRPFTKTLKSKTPRDTGDTRKAVKVKAQRGIGITAGFSGAKGNMPAYMKAYWLNYGTLSNRASGHPFSRPRKSKTSSWRGGIKAKGFVEESWEQTKNTVQDTLEKELKEQTHKFLQKHAVK